MAVSYTHGQPYYEKRESCENKYKFSKVGYCMMLGFIVFSV